MKTVLTKKIDGYDIIIGFDRPLIDQEATKKAIKGPLTDSEEAQKVKNKSDELSRINQAKIDLSRSARVAYNNGQMDKYSNIKKEFDIRERQLEEIGGELRVLLRNMDKKRNELFTEKAVYFEPKAGEDVVSDDEANTLQALFVGLEGEVVTRAGEKIADHRGARYIKDGQVVEIKALGVVPDGPLYESVSPEELETMRLDAMMAEAKVVEADNIKNSLLTQASSMRSGLEIQGDDPSVALQKSQDWYNAECAKVDEKYGI
jgi:hypothetical protein